MKHGSQQRFSIRKYSFGAASVLIASLVFMGGQVQADSLAESSASTEATSQTVASSSTEVVTQITSEPTPASSQKEVEPSTETSSVAQAELVPSESVSSVSESKVETKVTPEVQPASSKVESPAIVSSSSSSPVVAPSVNPVRRAATAGNPNVATLPDSGTYVFEEKTAVHSQPNLSSTVVATYQKGQSVIYDRLLSADERLWLSYIGASGARRYVALPGQNQSGQTTDSAVANTLNALAPQGTYTFSKTAGVKNEARLSSPDLAFYSPGQSVRYDRVLTAENHRWISYISYSGFRRYVAIEELPQVPKVEKTGQVSAVNVSSSGYDVIVKNVNYSVGVKEVLVLGWSEKNGQDDIIWHKAVKQSDGSYKVRIETSQHKQDFGAYHSHVYYVTNQNKHEYVTATKVTVPQVPKVEKTGQVSAVNVSSSGYDVIVKNVNHPAGVKEVLVPSWSEKTGQDDIIWHKA
ncbi:SH3 domain-containing protein, partial [Streptococcus danieliae]|nr:SH3 domain-containing protein [Streptococcus danieliae]